MLRNDRYSIALILVQNESQVRLRERTGSFFSSRKDVRLYFAADKD